jgi:hypothetical protein
MKRWTVKCVNNHIVASKYDPKIYKNGGVNMDNIVKVSADYLKKAVPTNPKDQLKLLKNMAFIQPASMKNESTNSIMSEFEAYVTDYFEEPLNIPVKYSRREGDGNPSIDTVCLDHINASVAHLREEVIEDDKKIGIRQIIAHKEMRFNVKFIKEYNMKTYEFRRINYITQDKFNTHPAHAELIAKLIDQLPETDIINSWAVNDGVVVLMNMNTTKGCKHPLKLFFLPQNFCGRFPEECAWSSNDEIPEIDDQCHVFADYNKTRNLLCLLFETRNANGDYDQLLASIQVSVNFKSSMVIMKRSINFLNRLYVGAEQTIDIRTFPTGIKLNKDCTKGMITIKTIRNKNEDLSYALFVWFDPFTLIINNRIADTEIKDYDVYPLYINEGEKEFYVAGPRVEGDSIQMILSKITTSTDEENGESLTAADVTAYNDSYTINVSEYVHVAEINNKITKLFFANATNNPILEFFNEIVPVTMKTSFWLKETAMFIAESIKKYGFSEVERVALSQGVSNVYPLESVLASILLGNSKTTAKEQFAFNKYITKELGAVLHEEIKMPIQISTINDWEKDSPTVLESIQIIGGKKKSNPDKYTWPFVFKMTSLPRQWFSVTPSKIPINNIFDEKQDIQTDDSITISSYGLFSECRLMLERTFPYMPLLRSIMRRENSSEEKALKVKEVPALSIAFLDLFNTEGSSLLSSITGVPFTKLSHSSCAVACNYSPFFSKDTKYTINSQDIVIADSIETFIATPILYMSQALPLTSHAAFPAMFSALCAGDVVIINIGSNIDQFIMSLQLLVQSINGIDEYCNLLQSVNSPYIALVCDLGVNYTKNLIDLSNKICGVLKNSSEDKLFENKIAIVPSSLTSIEIAKIISTQCIIPCFNKIKDAVFEGAENDKEWPFIEKATQKIRDAGATFGAISQVQKLIIDLTTASDEEVERLKSKRSKEADE